MNETFDRQLQAIQELGRRRSRISGIAFGIAWSVMFVLLFFFLGIIIGGVVSCVIAGIIAVAVRNAMTPGAIEKVTQEFGISAEELQADKYLVT